MNKNEMMAALGEATSQTQETCEKVVKAFERISGGSVLGTLIGKPIKLDKIGEISAESGVPEDVCREILTALDGIVRREIKKKLPF